MRIGTIDIDRPLCLAPMEDITDQPFRVICKERGADLLYTEFISCEALIRRVTRSMEKLSLLEEERPIAIQIYGSAEESMEQAATMAQEAGADFVDVNCGCWVKKIAGRGDGAGLLRDLGRFERTVASVQRGTSLPVTVKTRLGWDTDGIVIEEVAQMLEAMGIAALTIHCRTRKQGYSGVADWSWLPRIKAKSAIPLIANGDICSVEDAQACLKLGADGLMIGRAAIQNPWIFSQVRHYLNTGEVLAPPALEERFALCFHHLRTQADYRGERRGVLSFRKNYAAYIKGLPHAAQLRKDLMQLESVDPIVARLELFLEKHQQENETEGAATS
jgi:tRNA-dihydrouridine synthase B